MALFLSLLRITRQLQLGNNTVHQRKQTNDQACRIGIDLGPNTDCSPALFIGKVASRDRSS